MINPISIPYYPIFSEITKSSSTGLFLSLLYYWHQTLELDDGWFLKSYDEINSVIRLTRREWESARLIFKSYGLVEVKRRGINPVFWYKLNIEKINSLLA